MIVAGSTDHPQGGRAAALANVQATGALTAGDLAGLYARAPIFALPARYEPFGLAVLEAAAAGCALVLGDIPSLRENWSGAAIFVDAKDPAALRATINALIANPQERTRLAATARDRAHHFTLDRMALAYAALYRDMMRPSIRLETA